MEKSENAKSKRTDLQTTIIALVAIISIVIVTMVGLIFSAKYEDDKSQQNHETQIQSLISKYDSLRKVDMALIMKLQEKKPVVFIPKYTPTVKIDENYVRDKMGDWIWYGKEPETLCQFVADMVNEQKNNAYKEGFKDGYNKGRREQ